MNYIFHGSMIAFCGITALAVIRFICEKLGNGRGMDGLAVYVYIMITMLAMKCRLFVYVTAIVLTGSYLMLYLPEIIR